MKLNEFITESRNPNSYDLDECSSLEIIQKMNNEDKKVAYCVEKELPKIATVIDQVVECFKKNGRLIYVGAGTSGRIGILDAVECPPTFGMDPSRVIGLLAGSANINAKEEAEDSYEGGKNDLKKINLSSNDMVIGIAASGRTPYVIGALDYTNSIGACSASITCNPNSEISKHATYSIEINNGPEILTGSTRLKAGTSQKMVCNMITTASMIQLGKVYENLMVDVEVSNEKLRARWNKIVSDATNTPIEICEPYYEKSNKNAKTAILMILLDVDQETANNLLNKNDGFVKKVLKGNK